MGLRMAHEFDFEPTTQSTSSPRTSNQPLPASTENHDASASQQLARRPRLSRSATVRATTEIDTSRGDLSAATNSATLHERLHSIFPHHSIPQTRHAPIFRIQLVPAPTNWLSSSRTYELYPGTCRILNNFVQALAAAVGYGPRIPFAPEWLEVDDAEFALPNVDWWETYIQDERRYREWWVRTFETGRRAVVNGTVYLGDPA